MTVFETKADWPRFRAFAVASGLSASVLFVVLGVATRLQMFGDGSIFSYAVAAQDAWTFHWHNISGRLFTYLSAYIVPEQIVSLTGNARAGIAAYGTLFFAAPLFGLLLTFAGDRTLHRTLFTCACLSTACLDPLVYGAPTEMWMAHALFWPALAACLCAPLNRQGAVAVGILMLAFMLTHEGAIVLAISILVALSVRGWRDPRFLRACRAFVLAMLVWAVVKLTIRPDAYIAAVLDAAAFRFIDIRNLAQPAFLILVAALIGYAAVLAILRARRVQRPHLCAAVVCAAALILFWMRFDRWLLTDARYNLRTMLLMAIPVLGFIAALQSMTPDEWDRSPFPFLRFWLEAARRLANPRALTGALALVLLVNAVETGKFLIAWTEYKSAIRALASGSSSDPALGDPLFVSSQRIRPDLNRLAWNSTTPFLSVLVTPNLAPARLVVDPSAGYFWLSCKTARESEATSRAIPENARRLIRIHACLHRPN
jgi:hypothetical protein